MGQDYKVVNYIFFLQEQGQSNSVVKFSYILGVTPVFPAFCLIKPNHIPFCMNKIVTLFGEVQRDFLISAFLQLCGHSHSQLSFVVS